MVRHVLYSFSMFLVLGGCSEAALMPSGGACVRAAQCMPGLVCVLGQCTTDLSGLEGGVVPSLDADMMVVDAGDAGDVDAGPIGVDSGPMMRDAGPGVDSGPMVMRDAGPLGMDSGPPMMDAGTDAGPPPMMDAGSDAGPPPMMDAGTDAGPPPPLDAG